MEEMDSKQNSEEDNSIAVKIGVIGESGLDSPIVLRDRVEYPVCTPFGRPSDTIIEGYIEDVQCYLLSRHGRLHDIMPSNVNYRANIWAMRKLGCTHILGTHTVSSLNGKIMPGDVVVPNDVIDHTSKRAQTFYDGAVGSPLGVCHLPMCPPFCGRTRQHLVNAARAFELPTHDKATALTLEGPRYSTAAENNMYRKWGGEVLSMTLCPEAVLAKEAGILYASLSLVTNMDCWCSEQPIACTHEIIYTFQKQFEKVHQALIKAIVSIGKEDWSEDVLLAKKLVCSNFSNYNK